MQLGYELVKEQLFFRRELIERAYWLIHLRWIACGVALVAGGSVYLFLEPRFPLVPVNLVILCLLLCNALFLFVHRRLRSRKSPAVKPFTAFAHVQIGVDLLALFVVVYFTGGIYSPLLLFSIFHIILAGILLSPLSCFIYGLLVIAAPAGLVMLQGRPALPTPPRLFESPLFHPSPDPAAILISYLVFAATILITASLVTTIKLSLRTKGRELLRVSKDLDASNAKLTALYEMVKEMGLCADLQKLMDSATGNAARIMGVRACSIKLLDEQRKSLKFASTYGLSEDYLAKGSIDIDRSPINRKIIEGSYYAIGKMDEKDYFQHPEDILKEGIASMMCLPLRIEKMVLGVFCVYSGQSYRFSEEDVDFFALMADLTALRIENLRSELSKSWFLQKTAHQLRSPLNAIHGMLGLLPGGYLGPANPEQIRIVERCQRRIETLRELITDLLKIGMRRTRVRRVALRPMDLRAALRGLSGLYGNEAQAKGLSLNFDVDEDLPRVLGDEKLFDELFTNLISNAIKYTPRGGRVDVTLRNKGEGQVQLEVADTGIGIAEDEIPRLFSEFHRAENAKALTDEGTGLGLVIVKETLDQLRGAVFVKSRLGEGTRITCLLPAAGA